MRDTSSCVANSPLWSHSERLDECRHAWHNVTGRGLVRLDLDPRLASAVFLRVHDTGNQSRCGLHLATRVLQHCPRPPHRIPNVSCPVFRANRGSHAAASSPGCERRGRARSAGRQRVESGERRGCAPKSNSAARASSSLAVCTRMSSSVGCSVPRPASRVTSAFSLSATMKMDTACQSVKSSAQSESTSRRPGANQN
jgi:hypothetical protein